MSDERNDGGPAFAAIGVSSAGDVYHQNGMSLRDWIAGQALVAIIQADGIQYASSITAHAVLAYEQADAMLAARSQP